jgi:hypothetical protein
MKGNKITLEFFNHAADTSIDSEAATRTSYENSFEQAHAERILKNSKDARLKPDQGFVFKEGSLVIAAKKEPVKTFDPKKSYKKDN